LQAFPQGQIWYAQIAGLPGRQNIPLDWFQQFASRSNADNNGMIMFYAIYAPQTGWTHRSFVTYAQPQSYPEVYRGLVQRSVFVTEQKTTFRNVAQMNADSTPSGTRSSFATWSFINNAAYMSRLLDLAERFTNSVPGLTTMNLIFQPLWTTPRTASFKSGGGNVLGIQGTDDDMVIALLHLVWTNPANDNPVREAERSFLANARLLARQMGVHHPYLYANYAEEWQDVMTSYGNRSLSLMRSVSAKYDANGLFQRNVPGGFKLWPKQASQSQPFAVDLPDVIPQQVAPQPMPLYTQPSNQQIPTAQAQPQPYYQSAYPNAAGTQTYYQPAYPSASGIQPQFDEDLD
jgi:hypothetical protein